MGRSILTLTAVLLALGLATGGEAAAKVRSVASTPDLKALTDAVGGDLVDVVSLVRGTQNAHDVEVRPSLMLKLRHADLLVRNGLGLDYWVEPLVVGAHNARILPGTAGYVDASRGVAVIPPKGPIDRSRGDVHPEGDPHYTLDPANAGVVTANIVEGLRRVAPQHGPLFETQRREFLGRLEAAMARWQKTLEPYRGAKVVTYHETFNYFLRRFGLELAGAIEDRPGIPPSPAHLAELIRTIREQKIKVIVAEPYADRKVVELVARDSGARTLVLPSAVGGIKGIDSYLDLIDHNVRALAEALR
ncbi:MAG TPA: metal ABC transporter substrate-binding protein [Methylomirabilota bacterium]|jgi:ABC-type Zn uptake system ZnuABC Zn-binding protein ZnuA|nr:metal ABC transporter substrate-binding protein [Methylomirabilota bacterium]